MDLRVFLLLLLGTQFSLGIFIPSANRDFRKKAATIKTETKYSDLLRDLAVIKLRLETMGLGPVYIEGPYDNGRPMAKSLQDNDPVAQQQPIEDPASPFNEMEVLELVPVIIEQKRKGNVSPDEEKTLKEIFGDLWIVIEEEVNRVEGEEMNPILTALLQSHENRLKRALVQHHSRPQRQAWKRVEKKDDGDAGLEVVEQNDIFGNTVDRVRVTRFPKAFMEVNPAELSPQQRLMRHAALLIRQWFDENSPSRNARRGGLLRNRGPGKKRNINGIRGGQRRRPNNNRRSTNKRRGGGGGGGSGNRRRNLRPKRHNTDIYVDDNHAPYDYEDFEDYFAIDDSMTKPRSMRSSARTFFNEYDSLEEEDDDDEVKMIDEEDY